MADREFRWRAPASVRGRLSEAARGKTKMFLDSGAHVRDNPCALPDDGWVRNLLTADLTRVAARDARDAFEAFRAGGVTPDVAAGIRDRLPDLFDAFANDDDGLTASDKRMRLFALTMFAAGAMIPALAAAGRYRDAARVARAHTGKALSAGYAEVSGAGGTLEGHPQSRFILLSPVLWSLAGHLPESPAAGA